MLITMTMSELRVELDKAIAAGDDDKIGLIEDYLSAAEIDFAECAELADYEGIDDSDDFDDFVD
jgi:hypothetical protein